MVKSKHFTIKFKDFLWFNCCFIRDLSSFYKNIVFMSENMAATVKHCVFTFPVVLPELLLEAFCRSLCIVSLLSLDKLSPFSPTLEVDSRGRIRHLYDPYITRFCKSSKAFGSRNTTIPFWKVVLSSS